MSRKLQPPWSDTSLADAVSVILEWIARRNAQGFEPAFGGECLVADVARLVRRNRREDAPGLCGMEQRPEGRGDSRPDPRRERRRRDACAFDFDLLDVLGLHPGDQVFELPGRVKPGDLRRAQ